MSILLPLTIELHSKDKNTSPIKFSRLISLENIKELPFLNSLVKIPKMSTELNSDIAEFMDTISEMECPKFSQLAKTISLAYKLNDELSQKEIKKQHFKL